MGMGYGQNHEGGQKFVVWERLIIKPPPHLGILVVLLLSNTFQTYCNDFFFFWHVSLFKGKECSLPNLHFQCRAQCWLEGSAPSLMNKEGHPWLFSPGELTGPTEAGGAGD